MIDAAMLDDPAGRIDGVARITNRDTHRLRLKGATVEDAAPCDGCELAPKCATGFACHRFVEWVVSGQDKAELSRVPARGRFVRLFSELKPERDCKTSRSRSGTGPRGGLCRPFFVGRAMIVSPALEASFLQNVGPLWHEIKAGAWHTTSAENFQKILRDGAIIPGPIPKRLIEQDIPACFSALIGAVSVFDFLEADWAGMQDFQRHQWYQFFNGCWHRGTSIGDDGISIAIEIDRNAAPGWRSVHSTLALWKNKLDRSPPPGNLIPRHEACHDGPIPLTAFRRALEIVGEAGKVQSYREISIKSSG